MNLFLYEWYCGNDRIIFGEMDQKKTIDGTTDFSCLVFVFREYKVSRLYAKLYDAAGIVRWHTCEFPDYHYKIERRSNSCLFGQVTGLFFSFSVELFLFSIFWPSKFEAVHPALHEVLIWNYQTYKTVWEFKDRNVQKNSFCTARK